ncbi:ChbG/HpnK family deacetylase [Candidatus Poribacteria bacterium]|jgi:chitin disaccharide deacetylase|nr:ChbG/HpnK family deacetylase [Candidatus Poribacteria bacterium]MBT5536161.1 ChbG/HpnK family deacetylase [Candidatus Poribacteria bacterium]MBT5713199.1 ChbG/HpnK family deacetylase [Candidatus Poribacteria bacterium]MBT7098426.1 ChbG/HpnK family deacetylase [Candidatus Poribacteria bacterium]MBT7805409.1 ChbG/HpnK family deacetylase [Candidatus Poribacteria bacterium]
MSHVGLTLAFALAAASSTMNLAERLGYDADTRLLIVHADDVGLSHGVNVATAEAVETGSVSSFSVMAPAPWLPEIAALCRDNPDWDVGVHLALTSEWKRYRWGSVASAADVPGLLDDDGYMYKDIVSVALRAKPEEVERELRAQIDRVIALGIDPTHLDTHMGAVYARPEFFEVYYRLGVEYGIPVMVSSPTGPAIARAQAEGYPIDDRYLDIVRNGPLPAIDELITGVANDELDARTQDYRDVIRGLPAGVTQIIVHLATDSAETRAITSAWRRRHNDYRIFTDPAMAQFLDEQNVKLVGWRDLHALIAE